jgi:hypothetical protein
MKYRIAAALLIFVGAAVSVAAGAGFAAYAIFAAFLPTFGAAWAAVMTAAILLLVPALGLIVLSLRARRARNELIETLEKAAASTAFSKNPSNITLTYLASLAREKPLIAILLSGLYGAATMLLRDKK